VRRARCQGVFPLGRSVSGEGDMGGDGMELDGFLSAREECVLGDLWLRETRTRSTEVGTGTTISIGRKDQAGALASCFVSAAESAPGVPALGLSPAQLAPLAVLSDVKLESENPLVLAALGYAAARRARIMQRVSVAARTLDAEACRLMRLFASDDSGPLASQRVDIAAHYAAEQAKKCGSPICASLRAREVEESAKRWLAGTAQWGFFRAVYARTLTRAQYVYALSNIYQFVRQTTRLAARGVACSPSTEMRSHFIKHLNGEVNHELIIERDLAQLGEDVSYVRDSMAPNGPTQEFMAIQESMIGFYQDPVLLLSSPIAAEGVSAHLDEEFVRALHECLSGWGVAAPEKCSRFLVSHIHTDGGDDGHWEMTVSFLSSVLLEEAKHQFFLRSMRSAMRGTERLYESFVGDLPSLCVTSSLRVDESQPVQVRA
jgi:hypothetical protein